MSLIKKCVHAVYKKLLTDTGTEHRKREQIWAKTRYPQDRQLYLDIAFDNGAPSFLRETAVQKLPYPEERDALRKLALLRDVKLFISDYAPSETGYEDYNHVTRAAAIRKLSCKQDKDLLSGLLPSEKDTRVLNAVQSKLAAGD